MLRILYKRSRTLHCHNSPITLSFFSAEHKAHALGTMLEATDTNLVLNSDRADCEKLHVFPFIMINQVRYFATHYP